MGRRTERMAAVALAGAVALSAAPSATAVERPEYEVVAERGPVEVRSYPAMVLVETEAAGDFEWAGDTAFRRLFDYISGANRGRREIAMTAPVVQSARPEKVAMTAPVVQRESEGGWRVAFILPAEYTLATAPEPTDGRLAVLELPPRTVAAVRFSGTWSGARFAEHEAELRDALPGMGLAPAGDAVWARYDPPFVPWFLRRNEVLVPVEGVAETR